MLGSSWKWDVISYSSFYHNNYSLICLEYKKINFQTSYYDNCKKLAEKVQDKLQEKGQSIDVYVGFNFIKEYSIEQALSRAQKEGINVLIVITHGAAYSEETTRISFNQIENYLSSHKEWNVHVKGIRSFIRDTRFVELLFSNIQENIESFMQENHIICSKDICIFFPVHGVGISKEANEL